MVFCYKCGTQIPDDGVFCPKCGTQIAHEFSESTPSIAPPVDNTQQTVPSPLTVDPTYAPVFSVIGLFSPKGRRSNSTAFLVGFVTMLMFYGVSIIVGPTPLMFIPLVFIYIGATNLVKRLHDMNRTGYWAFLWIGLWMIPVVVNMIKPIPIGRTSPHNYISGFFWLAHLVVALFITTEAGTVGSNQYGPSPADKPVKQMDALPKN